MCLIKDILFIVIFENRSVRKLNPQPSALHRSKFRSHNYPLTIPASLFEPYPSLYGAPIFPCTLAKMPGHPPIFFSIAALAHLGNPCTLILRGIKLTKTLHYMVNRIQPECCLRIYKILQLFCNYIQYLSILKQSQLEYLVNILQNFLKNFAKDFVKKWCQTY